MQRTHVSFRFRILNFYIELDLDRGIIDDFVHPLHVSRHVHLLLRLVNAVGTLELGLLAALPLLMVSQRALQLIDPSADGAVEATTVI